MLALNQLAQHAQIVYCQNLIVWWMCKTVWENMCPDALNIAPKKMKMHQLQNHYGSVYPTSSWSSERLFHPSHRPKDFSSPSHSTSAWLEWPVHFAFQGGAFNVGPGYILPHYSTSENAWALPLSFLHHWSVIHELSSNRIKATFAAVLTAPDSKVGFSESSIQLLHQYTLATHWALDTIPTPLT